MNSPLELQSELLSVCLLATFYFLSYELSSGTNYVANTHKEHCKIQPVIDKLWLRVYLKIKVITSMSSKIANKHSSLMYTNKMWKCIMLLHQHVIQYKKCLWQYAYACLGYYVNCLLVGFFTCHGCWSLVASGKRRNNDRTLKHNNHPRCFPIKQKKRISEREETTNRQFGIIQFVQCNTQCPLCAVA